MLLVIDLAFFFLEIMCEQSSHRSIRQRMTPLRIQRGSDSEVARLGGRLVPCMFVSQCCARQYLMRPSADAQ